MSFNELLEVNKKLESQKPELETRFNLMQFQIDQMNRLLFGAKRERFIQARDENQMVLRFDIEQKSAPEKQQETITYNKGVAYTKLARWFNDITDSEFKSFNTISATIYSHHPEILNFFDNRSTNASAESFNAKIKAFRTTQRGVTDISFFLFRLANISA